jgi:hypothetical protein
VWGTIATALLLWYVGATVVGTVYGFQDGFSRAQFFFLKGVPAAVAQAVVGLVVGSWLILGAWRRTVWGAPPAGLRDVVEMRHLDRESAEVRDPHEQQ